MVFEIKRENGLIFAVDTVDIKEIGEHETGGTYIVFNDGSSLLLEQNYVAVKKFFSSFTALQFDFIPTDFSLMSKQKYRQLKEGKRCKKGKQN